MVYKKKKGWKPGADTVAYYPLVSDVLDHSGNGNNGSGSPSSFTGGVANYSNSGEQTIIPYSLVNGTTGTVNIWVYRPGGNNSVFMCQLPQIGNGWGFTMWYKSGAKFGWESDITKSSPTANTRNLFTGTWNGSTYKFYYNGTYIGQKTSRSTSTNPLYLGNSKQSSLTKLNWKLSQLIIENIERTAEEIQAYYNLTKSNYGL